MNLTLSKKTKIWAFILGGLNLIIGSSLFALKYSGAKPFLVYGGVFTGFAMLLMLAKLLMDRNSNR